MNERDSSLDSLLRGLPYQEKVKRKKQQQSTLKALVEEYFEQLEKAYREKNYSYEELTDILNQYAHERIKKTISPESLRKYMGQLRRQQQEDLQQEKRVSTVISPPKPHERVDPPASPPRPPREDVRPERNPARRLPRSLTADPSENFRKSRYRPKG